MGDFSARQAALSSRPFGERPESSQPWSSVMSPQQLSTVL